MTGYLNCSGCRGETMDHSCGREPKNRILPQSFYENPVLSLQTKAAIDKAAKKYDRILRNLAER